MLYLEFNISFINDIHLVIYLLNILLNITYILVVVEIDYDFYFDIGRKSNMKQLPKKYEYDIFGYVKIIFIFVYHKVFLFVLEIIDIFIY